MASSGPNSPASVTENGAYGDSPWDTESGATAAGGGAARTDYYFGFASYYLKAVNFGFDIPEGATIDGIVVEINRRTDPASNSTVDDRVRIVKGDTVGETDKASATPWPASFAYASYGAEDDLWGETWEPADLNASDFGVVLSVVVGDSESAYVDHIRITVHYTAPEGGSTAVARTLLGVG